MRIKADLVEWEYSGYASLDIRLPNKKKGWQYRILHFINKKDNGPDGRPRDTSKVSSKFLISASRVFGVCDAYAQYA